MLGLAPEYVHELATRCLACAPPGSSPKQVETKLTPFLKSCGYNVKKDVRIALVFMFVCFPCARAPLCSRTGWLVGCAKHSERTH